METLKTKLAITCFKEFVKVQITSMGYYGQHVSMSVVHADLGGFFLKLGRETVQESCNTVRTVHRPDRSYSAVLEDFHSFSELVLVATGI